MEQSMQVRKVAMPRNTRLQDILDGCDDMERAQYLAELQVFQDKFIKDTLSAMQRLEYDYIFGIRRLP